MQQDIVQRSLTLASENSGFERQSYWVTKSRDQKILFCKGPNSKKFCLAVPVVSIEKIFSSSSVQRSHRQYVNDWA